MKILRYMVPEIKGATEIFVILGHFCPFSALTTWKIKILKLEKTPGDIILHICTINDNHMMYGSLDMYSNRQNFLSFWTVFFPFTGGCGPRKSKFWKNKKQTWRYYHFTNVYHKWQSYDVWFLRYGVQQTKCFVIFDHFLPFYPPNNPKNQNFEKMKNTPGDIIILHMWTINHNHMMYGSWDMKRDGQNFLSFWTIFCPFTPLKPEKSKFWKNEKKPWRYYHFTQVH